MGEPEDLRIAELEAANRELREANLELSRELIDSAREIEAIRGSLRWRLLLPFEGLASRFRRGG